MSNNSDVSDEVFEYTGEGCVVPKDVTIVRFHPSVTYVKGETLHGCKQLRKVILNDGLQKIGWSTFSYCTSLLSITFPSTVTEVGSYAFCNCVNLSEVLFNEGLQKIREDTFRDCTSLSSITIPSNVTEIRTMAFCSCVNLREVQLNEGLQKIWVSAFRNCKLLSSIKLPSTITEIGSCAFADCDSLREVVLNEGLQKIGMQAFHDCNNLREVVFRGVPREIGYAIFSNCASLERVIFPTIATRLDTLIQTGHWDEIENEVNGVRGLVEMSGGDLFVSAQAMDGSRNWNRVRDDLDKIVRLISCYEIKEGTSMFELALWKFKLDQVDKSNPIPRKKCRMDAPGPVKDVILQYLR